MTPDAIIAVTVYLTIIHILAVKGIIHFFCGD